MSCLLSYMAHCLGHTVLWDVFVPIFTIAWPGSFFSSKVDIFVAAWSITDSFCCRYSRISDGTEDSLRVTVTYMSRFGLHFLGVIASEVVLAWPPNALLGSSRMEYGQSKNPHTVHLAVSHVHTPILFCWTVTAPIFLCREVQSRLCSCGSLLFFSTPRTTAILSPLDTRSCSWCSGCNWRLQLNV